MLEKLPEVVGRALSEVRAGLEHTMIHQVDLRQGMAALLVTSPAFIDHGPLPERCTADGEGSSPPLRWTGVPEGATEVLLIVEDADSPTPRPLVHAIAHGLAAADGEIREGDLDSGSSVETGRNSFLGTHWLPPDPPPGHGRHRYIFQVFALGPGAPVTDTPGREAVHDLLMLRGLASGWMVGTYERPSGEIRETGATPVAA